MAHLRYNYYLSQITALETFTQVEYDEFARLNLRFLYGGGVRFEMHDGIVYSALGFSLMYENEDIRETAGIPSEQDAQIIRSSNYFNFNLVFDNFSLINTLYIQQSLASITDLRMLYDGGITANLSDNLQLVVELEIKYDSEPPARVDRTELSLSNGIVFNFGS